MKILKMRKSMEESTYECGVEKSRHLVIGVDVQGVVV